MAAVTGGYGGCNGTQRQAKSAAATATATTGDSSCDGGQQREKAAAKMGDSLATLGDGGLRQLRTAALTQSKPAMG